MLHTLRIFAPVYLRAQGMDRRTLAQIEHPALKRIFIRRLSHLTAQSVYLSDKMPL